MPIIAALLLHLPYTGPQTFSNTLLSICLVRITGEYCKVNYQEIGVLLTVYKPYVQECSDRWLSQKGTCHYMPYPPVKNGGFWQGMPRVQTVAEAWGGCCQGGKGPGRGSRAEGSPNRGQLFQSAGKGPEAQNFYKSVSIA